MQKPLKVHAETNWEATESSRDQRKTAGKFPRLKAKEANQQFWTGTYLPSAAIMYNSKVGSSCLSIYKQVSGAPKLILHMKALRLPANFSNVSAAHSSNAPVMLAWEITRVQASQTHLPIILRIIASFLSEEVSFFAGCWNFGKCVIKLKVTIKSKQ